MNFPLSTEAPSLVAPKNNAYFVDVRSLLWWFVLNTLLSIFYSTFFFLVARGTQASPVVRAPTLKAMQEPHGARISQRIVCAHQPSPLREVIFDGGHAGTAISPQAAIKKLIEPLPSPSAAGHNTVDEDIRDFVKEVCSPSYKRPNRGDDDDENVPFHRFSPSRLVAICELVEAKHCGKGVVCHIEAPAKVFGDIHGQWSDLLDIFTCFGWPTHYRGDIEALSYVFNGDFVDRGPHSLEVVFFLFACKLLYPNNIVLVRGNHETRVINATNGFLVECKRRLGNAEGQRVWEAVNRVFEFLPLICVVSQKVLILHGGIGKGDWSIDSLSTGLKVPVNETHIHQDPILTNILWSDPAESDHVIGTHANQARGGQGIVCFPSATVKEFCIRNRIDLVIRSHQCVEAGFELFAGGKLCTIFSAVSYTGKFDNDASCMSISPTLECTVKVMFRRSGTKWRSPLDHGREQFFELLKDISKGHLSRHEAIGALACFSSSHHEEIKTVAQAMQSLLRMHSPATSPVTQSPTMIIVLQDSNDVITGQRLGLAQVYVQRSECTVLVLGPSANLMQQWLIARGTRQDVIIPLIPRNFSNGLSTIIDGALTAKDHLASFVATCDLIVVASDFNRLRVQRVYGRVFQTSVKIIETETQDSRLFVERLSFEKEGLANCMEFLRQRANRTLACLQHRDRQMEMFGWGECTLCKGVVRGAKLDGTFGGCTYPLLCHDCGHDLGQCIWCQRKISLY